MFIAIAKFCVFIFLLLAIKKYGKKMHLISFDLTYNFNTCHFNENVSISIPFQYAKLLSFLFHCQKILCYPEVTELIILCFKNNKDLSVVHRLILSTCILLEELLDPNNHYKMDHTNFDQ